MAKKYIDADLLRKEIESRMGDCDANSKNPNQLLWAELAALIPFIDSLQQEQPSEKTCKKCGFYENNCPYIRGKFIPYPSKVCEDYTYSVVKAQEQLSEDLEKEIDRLWESFADEMEGPHNLFDIYARLARHFANWQKEQMMKEAVEGYVNYYEDSGGILMAEAQVGCPYHIGDKVRIIIVKEGEDERVRKAILGLTYIDGIEPILTKCSITAGDIRTYLEKQKENIEKEYVFRPLAGTDITIAAEQAIRRVNEGDRLVLAFNGAYIPVRKGCDANKIVDIYDTFIEKQKETLHISETSKENADSFTDIKDGNIRGCIGMALADVSESRFKAYGVTLKECLAYLEKQKINTEGDFGRGYDCGYQAGYAVAMNEMKPKVATATLDSEKQKENPKTADSIPLDCTTDAKCVNRWLKVGDFLPDNGRDVLAKDALGNYLIAHYDGDQWFISGYDNEDKPIVYTPAIKEWCDIPSEKQKEQKPSEWSEGDENNLDLVIDCIYEFYPDPVQKYKLKDWLNSLRNGIFQNGNTHWKPSEEQMEALEYVIRDYREDSCNATANYLQEILDHLKNM